MKSQEVITTFTEKFSGGQPPTRQAVRNFDAYLPSSGRPRFVRLEKIFTNCSAGFFS
jgi:hypothetical protein